MRPEEFHFGGNVRPKEFHFGGNVRPEEFHLGRTRENYVELLGKAPNPAFRTPCEEIVLDWDLGRSGRCSPGPSPAFLLIFPRVQG